MNKERIITGNLDTVYKESCTMGNVNTSSWQHQLKTAIIDSKELCQLLELSFTHADSTATQQFPLIVPKQFINKMEKGNPLDPLLLQVLPQAQEAIEVKGFSNDPLEEQVIETPAGLLQKYHGRVLLILAGKCAINCRYCFRRHFPYEDARISHEQWQDILAYIRADNSIKEVILSGGEPLLVSDKKLAQYITDLESIEHVTTLRIHTRLPIVIPERLTQELKLLLSQSRLNTVIVLHSNHPNEIDSNLGSHIQGFKNEGVIFLNQSVLLAQINDNCKILENLSRKLFTIGVLPYYLHTLDEVNGAHHFNVPLATAKNIHAELKSVLSGYLVPKLVTEKPNEKNKVTLS